jgi:hypothetical protein
MTIGCARGLRNSGYVRFGSEAGVRRSALSEL